jgi:hypothetical protein
MSNPIPQLRHRKATNYVGVTHGGARHVLSLESTPTEAVFGHLYAAFIGPFRTRRAAMFMARYGRNNPHLQHVNDAERLARAWSDRRR